MSDLRGYTETDTDSGNKTGRLIATIFAVVAIIAAGIFLYRAVDAKPVGHQPPASTTSSVLSVQRLA